VCVVYEQVLGGEQVLSLYSTTARNALFLMLCVRERERVRERVREKERSCVHRVRQRMNSTCSIEQHSTHNTAHTKVLCSVETRVCLALWRYGVPTISRLLETRSLLCRI